ncbi:hypothetical protein GIB67_007694 [Kingdonia uniflora]|uniref:Uncharacterized protein n=1 Tax=Kingdonia uniflora TaxID=39325 RepID=A0A7J7N1P5_9MAGN|nr:hypothetical protein GIB67_007694 [Kingdonia uniflora]
MALNLDDGEFWLPSEFLTDDDFLMETTKTAINGDSNKGGKPDSGSLFCFPDEFPFGVSSFGVKTSNLNSPVESVTGSVETESDEEDCLAGLTRQMTRSMMIHEYERNPKTWGLSGSPQSTLCAGGAWSNGHSSHVTSPPSTPFEDKEVAWDLLYAAAGQVVRDRMKRNDGGGEDVYRNQRSKGLLGLPQKHSNGGFYPNQALTHHQIQQIKQFNQLKEMQYYSNAYVQQAKPSQINHGVSSLGGVRSRNRPLNPLNLPSSAWPSLQQQQQQQQQHHHHQQQQGMRAVFLGDSKRASTGTGVFLPRRAGNLTSEPRKKPACSTVLLPARVVQALNLNIDAMGSAQPRYGYAPRNNHNLRSHSQAMVNHNEVSLPQEWTY